MIYEHDCDTQLPNNIFDDEIYPSIKTLPPSRPLTEPTPIAYLISKSKLCNELGNILRLTNQVGRHLPYDEIIRFDAKVRQIMQEMPPHLQLNSLEGSHDPVTLIIARYNIEILYQKILCLLHRKYLAKARNNPRYAHSRRSAVEASLRALEHLSVLHRESSPNGRLRSLSWYVKSIATKDFILPAMLVILDLHYDNLASQSSPQPDNEGAFLWSQEQRSKMIGSLQEAREIWNTLADTSMEAFKAGKIIDIMLEKIRNPMPNPETQPVSRTESMSDLTTSAGLDTSPTLGQGLTSPESLTQFNPGANPFTPSTSSGFMGMDFGLGASDGMNLQTDGFGAAGPASPFSMFTNMNSSTNTGIDFNTNFDWVSSNLSINRMMGTDDSQNAFENYTQMSTWGADQTFQVYGTGQDQSSPEQESTSNGIGRGGDGSGGGEGGGMKF